MLLQWDTGAGKTVGASLVAQKLLDEDLIDLALFFVKKNKIVDWKDFLSTQTRVEVRMNDKERDARKALYNQWIHERPPQAVVLNYEKARAPRKDPQGGVSYLGTDLKDLQQLVKGRRVLFVFDEAHTLRNTSNKTSRGVKSLIKSAKEARALGLTATPLVTDPYNLYGIFKALVPGLPRVSTNKADFELEYASDVRLGRFGEYVSEWQNLEVLGRRVEAFTHVAMKTDPEIACQFPQMVEKTITLELSDQDRGLYRLLTKAAREGYDEEENLRNVQSLTALRTVCCTPTALRHLNSTIVDQLVDQEKINLDSLTIESSTKWEWIRGLVEEIIARKEKVVLFTFWANIVLKEYAEAFKRLGVPVWTYTGALGAQERADVVQQFNQTQEGGVLLSSDAGQDGINIYAPYLIHIETPHTYTEYKQRSDRIHRSDSHRYGINTVWVYQFLTHQTVEESVLRVAESRKDMAKRFTLDRESLRQVLFD